MKYQTGDKKSLHIFLPIKIPRDEADSDFIKFYDPNYKITKKIVLSPRQYYNNKKQKNPRNHGLIKIQNKTDLAISENSIYDKNLI